MAYDQSLMDNVREIAEDCQGGHPSFCSARCPMHTDATAYIKLISENNVTQALKKIREKLFLPGTLGRVCPAPCETECRRNTEYKQPISIAALKRFAADKADDEALWDISVKPSSGKKAAVIGAGPGGAQAAIDLAKNGHNVTVFEKYDVVGGMMRVGIPEYRLPRNIIDFEYKFLEKLGVEFKMGCEVGKDVEFNDLLNEFDTVIIANGAHKASIPPVSGAEVDGVTNGVDFLRAVSLSEPGLSVPETVIVLGAGDVAMDCARTAVRLGAKTVTIICIEREHEMPASKHEKDGALAEGITFNCGWGIDEIIATDGKISSVNLKECTSAFDKDGNFAPQFGTNKSDMSGEMLIFATGQAVVDVTGGLIEQGAGGRYVCDKQTLATSTAKVFVAGDCAGATIVVEAMALGKKAAISANRFLEGKDLSADRDFKEEFYYNSDLDIPLDEGVTDLPKLHTESRDPKERIKNFSEIDLGFDADTAVNEAARCLDCECKKCMVECIMLNDFALYPGALFKKFLQDGDMEPIVAYSCNMCDQCTLVCPKEFKFAELFGGIRKAKVKANNGQSPMPGHKAINMHQKLGFGKFFTVRIKGGTK